MEEIEVPLEKVTEDLQEHSLHSSEKWIGQMALASALLAVLAAIAALLGGHHANEAMIERIKSSDGWNHYQAKSIKAAVLNSKKGILEALGKGLHSEEKEKLEEYKKEQEEISEKVSEEEASSEQHLKTHQIFARAVTFFQVAIAVSAIAVLSKRRRYCFLSLGFGIVGLFFLIKALFT